MTLTTGTVPTQAQQSVLSRIPWRSVAIVVPFLAVFIALSIGVDADDTRSRTCQREHLCTKREESSHRSDNDRTQEEH